MIEAVMSTGYAASCVDVYVTQPDSSSGQVESPGPSVQLPAAQTFDTEQVPYNGS